MKSREASTVFSSAAPSFFLCSLFSLLLCKLRVKAWELARPTIAIKAQGWETDTDLRFRRPFSPPGLVWMPTVPDSLSLQCHPLMMLKMVKLETRPIWFSLVQPSYLVLCTNYNDWVVLMKVMLQAWELCGVRWMPTPQWGEGPYGEPILESNKQSQRSTSWRLGARPLPSWPKIASSRWASAPTVGGRQGRSSTDRSTSPPFFLTAK